MKKIDQILRKRPLILDGATGTQLYKRGMPSGVCPEAWCLKNPKVLSEVHSDYKEAGSDIVYAATFGANRVKLNQYRIKNITAINRDLVRLARKSPGRKTLIAGDIGGTGKFIEPFGKLSFDQAVTIFKEQIKGLLEGGVDLLCIETMIDIQEARAALIAAKELTDKFVMVTMTYEKDGRTLGGTDPLSALVILQSLGADAVGINCSSGPQTMFKLISQMSPYTKVPLAAKPNAGVPRLIKGKTIFNMGPKEFAGISKKFVAQGVYLIGGCCGSSPEHIRELKKSLKGISGYKARSCVLSLLASARGSLIIKSKGRPLIVGESINPSGKKSLRQELVKGQTAMVRTLAREQKTQGAELLDVNVGAAGVDEVKTLKKVVATLAINTDLPLVVDTSNLQALAQALKVYPGRALINSISAEKKKIKPALKIAAKYGAMFIGLPIDEKGVPKTSFQRQKNIQYIFKQAKEFNFKKEDIIVDILAMTVSSDPDSAFTSIKFLNWCTKVFKAKTIVGLSNISFGMPGRGQINAAYYSLLRRKGLNLAIAKASLPKSKPTKRAEDLLLGKGKALSAYLSFFSSRTQITKNAYRQQSPREKVSLAILEGDSRQIKVFIGQALKSGVKPQELVAKVMIPAINKVGRFFDRKEYFLPQLVASAQAMKAGFSYLKPRLKHSKQKFPKVVVILATVKGDIHDIGKNIVALMLKNHGFSVIDLGKDVSTDKIIGQIKAHKSAIVGLSALMTTTMVEMKETITRTKKLGLSCKFILGGAVVTKSYARALGAGYAGDGVEAVRLVKKLAA